jgi:hypothetical protein
MFCPQCRKEFTPDQAKCPECKVRLVEEISERPEVDPLDDKFVWIARFDTRLEAEAIGHALDQYDIPFLVKSDDIGIFGPGHVMSTPQGATLWVPKSRSEEVADLLSCVVTRDQEETDTNPLGT